jgi:hypothetical protein
MRQKMIMVMRGLGSPVRDFYGGLVPRGDVLGAIQSLGPAADDPDTAAGSRLNEGSKKIPHSMR